MAPLSAHESVIPPAGLPRLPIATWPTLFASSDSKLPCLADLPQRRFTLSGRHSIDLALRCLQIGKQDRVLVPSYHCPSMIAPVALAAEPVFYGIDAQGRPLLDHLSAAQLKGVRALLLPHYFGFPQAMAQARAWCDQRGIALIEDCAHAMFGHCDGRGMGQWGDYAIASIPKFFPASHGGLLVSQQRDVHSLPQHPASLKANLKALLNALEQGAQYGGFPGVNGLLRRVLLRGAHKTPPSGPYVPPSPEQVRDYWLELHQHSPDASHSPPWLNRIVVDLSARDALIAQRRSNYARLTELVSALPGVRPLFPDLPDGVVPYMFPLWVDQPDPCYQTLRQAGVPVFRWDDAWPCAPIPNDHGQLWAQHVFQLACHQDLSTGQICAMIKTLKTAIPQEPDHASKHQVDHRPSSSSL